MAGGGGSGSALAAMTGKGGGLTDGTGGGGVFATGAGKGEGAGSRGCVTAWGVPAVEGTSTRRIGAVGFFARIGVVGIPGVELTPKSTGAPVGADAGELSGGWGTAVPGPGQSEAAERARPSEWVWEWTGQRWAEVAWRATREASSGAERAGDRKEPRPCRSARRLWLADCNDDSRRWADQTSRGSPQLTSRIGLEGRGAEGTGAVLLTGGGGSGADLGVSMGGGAN